MPLLEAFLQNASLLLAIALIYDLRASWPALGARRRSEVVAGVLIGVTGMAVMYFPVVVEPGMLLDSRGILLAVAGLFFGLIPTVIAAAVTGIYRVALGGPGVSLGIALIVVSCTGGLVWRHFRRNQLGRLHWGEYAGLGLVIGLTMLGLVRTRVAAQAIGLDTDLVVAVLITHVGATTALGLLLEARQRRRETAAKLMESEASFRALTEQVPAVIYRAALDEHSSTLYVSPQIERFGVTATDWLADPQLWAERLHPDDRDRVLAQLAVDRANGASSDFTYRLRAGDGDDWRTIRDVSQLVLGPDGAPLYVQGLMYDITAEEVAAATSRLEAAALDAAADAIAITDRDGNIDWVNESFTALTGYTAAEAIGHNPRSLLRSGVQDEAFYRRMWDTLLAGKVWQGELVNKKKDGTTYTEEQTITPVKDEAGRVTNFIAIKRDITARRALELQYLQSQKMEGIGRLAGGVAHDLNNLLTVINGTVELSLPGAAADSPMRADLLEIRRAADRAAALTRQLLAFSRQQVLRAEVLDLNRVVADLLKMLTRVIGEDVKIVTRFDPHVGRIRADVGQLEQVVMNLTVNARDAMPAGGTLTIDTRNVELDEEFASQHVTVKAGPHVALIVTDTGVGMDAATRGRVFEPFFTTKDAGKGTGLGLSTVYGIVKQSGGSIWVYSETGRGTTFKIFFPRVDEPIKERTSGPSKLLQAGGTECVLVVEDEDAIRAVATRVLSLQGYTVLQAASGPAALEVAASYAGEIDLLMTDMVMPGMTGPELAQALLAKQPTLKVLFTSGYSADAVALQFGMTDDVHFISKPYGLADLTREVRRVLDDDEI